MQSMNQTMKLFGYCKKKRLSVLVDSGSTHNFLDAMVAKGMGCLTQLISAHRVLVANGDKLHCNAVCKGFEWKIQGTYFVVNILIMLISEC